MLTSNHGLLCAKLPWWTKGRSPLIDCESTEIEINPLVDNILTAPINSVNKENILAFIGGYIIRKLSKKIDCSFCFEAMLSNESVKHRFLSLVALKDRGGLIYPSEDVLKILNISERVFKGIVCGLNPNNLQINASRNLRLMLINKVMFESTNVFECLQQHDIENLDLNEDCYFQHNL